ncbi:MAG: hypothetical protein WBA89_20610 [Microcoleus sp.]|uniref:hypothetical protein n=1 Tax=Microcoleus sp. TaxID=44472 RepID=UPI003C720C2A
MGNCIYSHFVVSLVNREPIVFAKSIFYLSAIGQQLVVPLEPAASEELSLMLQTNFMAIARPDTIV